MAAKPHNASIMEGVVGQMKKEQTEGTCIEGATALAYAEAYTKATDLAGFASHSTSSVVYGQKDDSSVEVLLILEKT